VRRRRRAGGHVWATAAELHDALIYAGTLPTLHTLPSRLKSVTLSPSAPGAVALALVVYAHAVKLGLDRFLGRLAGASCGLPPPWTPHHSPRSPRRRP
jgi:hypothetical protein